VEQMLLNLFSGGASEASDKSKRLISLLSEGLPSELDEDGLLEFADLLDSRLRQGEGQGGKLVSLFAGTTGKSGNELPEQGRGAGAERQALQLAFLLRLGAASGVGGAGPGGEVDSLTVSTRDRLMAGISEFERLLGDARGSGDRSPGSLVLPEGLRMRLSNLAAQLEGGQTESRLAASRDNREAAAQPRLIQAATPQQLAALASTASQSGDVSSLNRMPPIQAPLGSQAWGDALQQRIVMMAGQGMDRAEIKLHPPHLGPLDIRIAVTQEQTSLILSSHNASTRDALEQALPRLRDMLQEQGLEMGEAEVRDGRAEDGDERSQGEARGRTPQGREEGHPDEHAAAVEVEMRLLDEYV